MIYRYICALAMLAAGVAASAQNLDPTVVVDRAYEGKLMEVHKPALVMAVPDTVMRFDLDFDYSVFDSPYKGTYEFNPHLLSMKPSAPADNAGKFYLRAGAGYQLYPELDVLWSPAFKKAEDNFRLDVYGRHRSYFGNYCSLYADDENVIRAGDGTWYGYDMESNAGVDLSYDWERGGLGLDVAYYGLHQKNRGYNAVDAAFDLSAQDASGFAYDMSTDYRYAFDSSPVGRKVGETNFDFDFALGKALKENSAFRVDLGVDLAGYKGYVEDAAADLCIGAHYLYNKGILQADLGAKLAKSITDTSKNTFVVAAKDQIIYPDVTVKLNVFPKFMSLFAKATGGTKVVSYSSLLEHNHYANISDTEFWDMGIEVERINASAGIDGRIGPNFSYTLHGGYVNYAAGMLDAVYMTFILYTVDGIYSGVEYAPYQKTFAAFDWMWRSDSFTSVGNITYSNAFGDVFGDAFGSAAFALKPAALTGNMSFEYNYKRRIFAGINADFSTARKGGEHAFAIPGYVDLGVSAEYVTSRDLSFWIKGGNLLGMTIYRYPVYAVKSPYFTAGFSVKF